MGCDGLGFQGFARGSGPQRSQRNARPPPGRDIGAPRTRAPMRCLGDRRRRLSAKTALAKAIRYALTRWDALIRYVGDGRIGIDNNPAERSLRGIAVTRKNFLFLGSEAGGERAAIRRSSMGSTPKPISPMSPTAWPRDIRSIA
jgi:hypothetical protein